MKKQNYASALLIIIMSTISLIIGAHLGSKYSEELKQQLYNLSIETHQNTDNNFRDQVFYLGLIKRGNVSELEKFLEKRIKSEVRILTTEDTRLNPGQATMISESSLKHAKELQNEFCNDQCLGL